MTNRSTGREHGRAGREPGGDRRPASSRSQPRFRAAPASYSSCPSRSRWPSWASFPSISVPACPALAWMGDSGSPADRIHTRRRSVSRRATPSRRRLSRRSSCLVLVLAVPILDTTLVTIVRLLDGRPVSQGGRDHSSHRLVSLGVSETGAVVLLALVSAALGATSLAYEAFGNGRIAAFGVLVTFALLIQLGQLPRRRRPSGAKPALRATRDGSPRSSSTAR